MRLTRKNFEFLIKNFIPKKYLFKKRILREIKKKKEPEIELIIDLINTTYLIIIFYNKTCI